MTQKNVEIVLGRLATDVALRQRFLNEPEALLVALREEGLELSSLEVAALKTTNAEAIRAFADALDRRIRKTHLDESE